MKHISGLARLNQIAKYTYSAMLQSAFYMVGILGGAFKSDLEIVKRDHEKEKNAVNGVNANIKNNQAANELRRNKLSQENITNVEKNLLQNSIRVTSKDVDDMIRNDEERLNTKVDALRTQYLEVIDHHSNEYSSFGKDFNDKEIMQLAVRKLNEFMGTSEGKPVEESTTFNFLLTMWSGEVEFELSSLAKKCPDTWRGLVSDVLANAKAELKKRLEDEAAKAAADEDSGNVSAAGESAKTVEEDQATEETGDAVAMDTGN